MGGVPPHHQPLRWVHTNKISDITVITGEQEYQRADVGLAVDDDVHPEDRGQRRDGRVTAAITASRSAAMVIFVPILVW